MLEIAAGPVSKIQDGYLRTHTYIHITLHYITLHYITLHYIYIQYTDRQTDIYIYIKDIHSI